MLLPKFFDTIRASSLYGGHLSQAAVDGMVAVGKAFDAYKRDDKCADDLAIIMATVVIETGMHFKLSIEEIGKGRGHPYGKPAGPYGWVYYGRGPCQITWLENYQKAKDRLGVDFVAHPDLMCQPEYGVAYMIDGMYNGLFRRYRLRNYVTPGVKTSQMNFVKSRNIINGGGDRAAEHGRYCLAFQNALSAGYQTPKAYAADRQPHEAAKVPVLPTPIPTASPAVVPPIAPPPALAPTRTFLDGLRQLFTGKSA